MKEKQHQTGLKMGFNLFLSMIFYQVIIVILVIMIIFPIFSDSVSTNGEMALVSYLATLAVNVVAVILGLFAVFRKSTIGSEEIKKMITTFLLISLIYPIYVGYNVYADSSQFVDAAFKTAEIYSTYILLTPIIYYFTKKRIID